MERCFPAWRSIEVFGAPGAGKSFLCRQLFEHCSVAVTAHDIAIRGFIDDAALPTTRMLLRWTGSSRVSKNYYKFRMDWWALRYWTANRRHLHAYSTAVEQAILEAQLPVRSQKNVRKSVRYSGLATALAYSRGERIVIDEGLIRKLITLFVQSKRHDGLKDLRELAHRCLVTYPWDKIAIFVDAPPDMCRLRQIARGHVLHASGRPQSAQHAAAQQVWDLCRKAGWQIIRVWNGPGLADMEFGKQVA